MSLVELVDVVGTRGDDFRVQVDGLSLDPGEAVAIVGRSGSGKSTILDMIAGIRAPVAARRFVLAGQNLADLWRRNAQAQLRAIRAEHVGYVLQTGGLAPFLTIAENAALPFWRDGRRPDQSVKRLLDELEIAHCADRLPRDVSVGERQRAAIARALAKRPDVVLADEPTAALDFDTAKQVMKLLLETTNAHGAALVIVTHDENLARRHDLRLERCRSNGRGRTSLGTAGPDPAPKSGDR